MEKKKEKEKQSMSGGDGVEMCGSVRVRVGRMGRWGAGGCRGWVDGVRTGLEMEAEGVSSCNNKNEWGQPSVHVSDCEILPRPPLL